MDSSSQLTIAYDMLYYVKLTALSIKTICCTLTLFVRVRGVIFYF